ncbi:NADH:ubiquinone reductase (Na(+)-transporting) subunit F [Kribbella qitaiheensis]|uniref:NADH:ubiquinone reductase (Na(+)-transporting) subunit F n=1 Tax=Kribbella qitaiheensis TaxID=1544730 RepID=UPI0019D602EC|nr:2Fe-2S iron-sulfur cluster binding domain-containing protein [Kribbella qitaiheensis]
MGDKHVVRFEPVGIEIEVDEDQTVLRAAAEQGIMLMHGCKEGQCSACKSFVLDGEDIELDRYSTFALPDYELEEGYTLLCRAHPYEDLTIELLNYDADMIRSGLPIQEATAEVSSNEPVTHDMRHLVLRLKEPTQLKFFPGQYVDFHVPGTDLTRSFSMANTTTKDGGRLEFVIRVYPGGLFSQYLDQQLAVGDDVTLTGPFGVFTLRDAPDARLVFLGGGAGMAPILSLLRSMAERGIDRPAVYYYGARRRRDLCFDTELRELADRLPRFSYVPALSEPEPGDGWEGETGLITDVVARHESGLAGADAYVCGPPPMVEAALPLLEQLGVAQKRIFYDKFTTTGDAGTPLSTGAGPAPAGQRDARMRQVPDDDHTRTQRSEACVHRRGGRGQGIPRLDGPPVQLLRAAEAQADPLRGRDGRGPAGPQALPQSGLAVRVLRRPRRLPAGLDRLEGLGFRPAGTGPVPRLGR